MDSPLATICVQTRGNRFDLFQRCLQSLLQHTPAGVFELRLGFVQANGSLHHALGLLSNGASLERDLLPGQIERFSWNQASGQAVHCWHAPTNLAKDVMTRHLFCDVPTASEYLVSFDDDSYVSEGWWESLPGVIDAGSTISGSRIGSIICRPKQPCSRRSRGIPVCRS